MSESTLMERAQSLFCGKGAAAAALVVVPLAAAVPDADAAQLTYSGVAVVYDSGGAYIGPKNVGGQIINNGQTAQLFGTAGPIAGADWLTPSAGLLFDWTGGRTDPTLNTDRVAVDYDFDVNFSGGSVEWKIQAYQSYVPVTPNSSTGFGSLFSGDLASSGHVEGLEVSSPKGINAVQSNGPWRTKLWIQWSGYSATDTISVSIPQNSIDFAIVPEPTALAILPLAATLLARRRRRARRCADAPSD